VITRAGLVVAPLLVVASLVGGAGGHSVGSLSTPPLRLSDTNVLSGDFGGIVAAGDLNGDGRADVLDERLVNRGISTVASMTARDGRTGHELWRWHGPWPNSGSLSAVTGRIGTSGRRGVVILSEADENDGASVVTLTALSGRSGHEVWRRRVASRPDGDIEIVDKTHDLPGADTDFVVAVADQGPRSLLEPVVVNGLNGHVVRLPAHVGAGEPEVALYTVPDLDGNGLDDLVLARGGAHAGIVAEDGQTGRVLWALRGSGFRSGNAIVTPVGRLTGSQAPDLVIGTNPPGFKGRQVQTLVQGSDGHILWRKRADQVLAVGRAGPHLVAAVDLVNDLQRTKARGGAAGISLRAFTPSGHLIYQTMVTLPASQSGVVDAQDNAAIAGDFQPDGAKDVQVAVFAPQRRHRTGWINGRTGHFHALPVLAFPVGNLSPVPGTDLVDVTPNGKHLLLTGVNAERHVYWRRQLSAPALYISQVFGLHASSSKCTGIAVTDEDFPGRQLAAVYTGSGHLLWTLRFPDNASFGGELSHHPSPTHPCARQ
jgi:hypothetical protein